MGSNTGSSAAPNPEPELPEGGVSPDGATTWPPRELVDSFMGSFDFSAVAEDAHVAPERAREFRAVLGRFASGVTVVTAMTGDGPVGMTCQSFSSASLQPPLVMFVPAKTSRAWPLIRAAGHFTVNLLGVEQEWLSNQFAAQGVDKYAGVSWAPAPSTGAPRLNGSLAWIDCTIHAVHDAGDHDLVLGRVQELVEGPAERPLLFYRSAYHRLAE
jgi:3-hydroxy-9,10-secoandrosta-1,3,5(10)-triene-9,17-dione monooxygenase reductase component